MRGKATDPVTMKALRLLVGHLTPLEIMGALGLPKRTVYDLIHKVSEQVAQEEAERQQVEAEEVARLERERLDRLEWERKVFVSLAREREQFSGGPGGGRFF